MHFVASRQGLHYLYCIMRHHVHATIVFRYRFELGSTGGIGELVHQATRFINSFSCSNQVSMKLILLINVKESFKANKSVSSAFQFFKTVDISCLV